MIYLPYLLVSVFSSYGLAVALTQKGEDFPLNLFVKPVRWLLNKLYPKLAGVFECVVCMSFWTTLITDIVLMHFKVDGHRYFAWPLSGFITLGLSWTVMELFNVLENKEPEEPFLTIDERPMSLLTKIDKTHYHGTSNFVPDLNVEENSAEKGNE
jgi:hypothetical protein